MPRTLTWPRITLAVALIVIAATSVGIQPTGASAGAVAATGRPNIILVMVDDARVDDIRYMPNVNRLIKRPGAVFPRASVSYPLCCPVRASILTGQYAHNHGVQHHKYPAGSYRKWVESGANESTLPVWLQKAGYHTVMVGKFLNGYGNYSRQRYGLRNAPKDPGWSSWKATVSTYDYRNLAIRHRPGKFRRYDGRYGTHVLNDIAVNVTRRQASNPTPFFLWLSYVAPHHGGPDQPDDPKRLATPNVANRDRNTFRHLGNVKSPAFNERHVGDKPSHIRALPRFGPKRAKAIKETRQQRVESLQAVDRGVGRLVRTLRRTGQLRNTVLIFTSDNGYSLGEHRRTNGKTLPYSEVMNVPLYVRGPGIPANRRVSQRVSMSIDMAPTVLDLARTTAPYEPDGISLYDLIRNPGPRNRDLIYEAWHPDGTRLYSGVRTWRHLYVEYPSTGETELYDMHDDPHQLRSRHDDPGHAAKRIELAAKLAVLRHCQGHLCQ